MWKKVRRYEVIPRGYRIVYADPSRDIGWCLPFGIHYVAILLRRIWIWTYVWPRPDWLEKHDTDVIRQALVKRYQDFREREDADRT